MKTFEQYIKDEFNLDMPKGGFPASWLTENGLPVVVHCTNCQSTMMAPACRVDEEGYTYCRCCAGED